MTFPSCLSPLVIGSLAVILSNGVGLAGDYGKTPVVANASRCSTYGPDFAAVEGSDTCMRIGGHVRVQLGTAGFDPTTWSGGQASAATLRSDGADPRPATTSHLRIHGGLEYPNPFH